MEEVGEMADLEGSNGQGDVYSSTLLAQSCYSFEDGYLR
jgi:hypothetical protein